MWLSGEQIYFAVSKTNSPVSWNTVNGARPVLTSNLGTKGLRDPFIIRNPSGNKFYVIATDLKIYGGATSWAQASRTGRFVLFATAATAQLIQIYHSLSLAVWESSDLKTWSAQRLVKVSPATVSQYFLCNLM